MKAPVYYRRFDYDKALIPNKYLASLELGVSPIDEAKTKTASTIGYPGWNLIYNVLISHLHPNRYNIILETGTNLGCTTIILAQALKDSGRHGKVFTVELDKAKYETALSNFEKAGVSELIGAVNADSCVFLKDFVKANSSIRVAFLDASHLFNDVLGEFEAIYPLLGPQSLAIFDNTYLIAEEHEDQKVNGALREILKRYRGNLVNFEIVSWCTPGVAIWQKSPFDFPDCESEKGEMVDVGKTMESTRLDLSRFDDETEVTARTWLAAKPDDLYAQGLIVDIQAERYKRSYEQLKKKLARDDSSYQMLDFNRFSMHLDTKEKGSLCTIACHTANLLEPFEVSLFGEMICRNPDGLIIDIGANYGLYTLYACDLGCCNIVAKVVAVEPDRRVFEKLSESVRENGFEEEVILFNKAASDIDGQEVDLFINKGGSLDNRTFVDGGINVADNYKVGTVTIDSVVSDIEKNYFKAKSIIVKIDIQGNEPVAIRGMAKTLSNYPSIALFFEFDPVMMAAEGFEPFEFAHELFALGFSSIVNINETTQSLKPLDGADDLIQAIRQCKSMSVNDPRRYTNILCYRDMKGPRALDVLQEVRALGPSKAELRDLEPEVT
jgi:FkbM family methyltransferase